MIKRSFDIISSFLGLFILTPLYIIISFLIWMNMGLPIFFLQKRTGRFGRQFSIIKFRTMVLNHGGNTVSIKGESRITKLGKILRKYKLDELPELWNVLTGDMSLVGPRPDVREYTERLSGKEKEILSVRPGITGPASIKYANEEEILSQSENPKQYNDEVLWPDKVRINIEYVKNHSFKGDLKILLKTIFRL